MLRTLTLGACAALCSSAALAQLPDPLERALSVSLNDPVAQRVDVMVGDNDGQITVRIQEDADGASHYTLLSPSEAGLNESEREMWEEMFLSDEDASEEDEEDGFGGEDFDAEDPRRLRPFTGAARGRFRPPEGRSGHPSRAAAPPALPDLALALARNAKAAGRLKARAEPSEPVALSASARRSRQARPVRVEPPYSAGRMFAAGPCTDT